MIIERMDKHPGARFLFILACLVVIVAGLRAAAPILVPFALALFLAIVSMPVMFALRLRRVPAPIAIGLTVLLDVCAFGLLVLLAGNSVQNLQARLPTYRRAFEGLAARWQAELVEWNLLPEGTTSLPRDLIPTDQLFDFIGATLSTLASVVSVGVLVAIILIFILAEATIFPFKFQSIFGHKRQGRIRLTKTIKEVQAYLGIKTLISLLTGLCAGVLCSLMRLDFPILLGMIAFVLNFIPTIGSILAAIPAVGLALILPGSGSAIIVGLGYLVINVVFGNLIEPNLMGRRLGLSTLVVVLSLLFWGWVWGPIGALLSVPLTMVLKIAFENTPDLRWVAILLDKQPPQARGRGFARARGGSVAGSDVSSDVPSEASSEAGSKGVIGDDPVGPSRAAG